MRGSARLIAFCWCLGTVACIGRAGGRQAPEPVDTEFGPPQRVTIQGYDGDAMEPFVSRDGKMLFFNNLNEGRVNTNLYWAARVDDLTFQFRGEVGGVNTPALEGVASMDGDGVFYFVSPRDYKKTASTLWMGRFADGAVTDVRLVPGVSVERRGIVNFDAEVSADGKTLYFVESQFGLFGRPKTAKILMARWVDGRFRRDDAESARVLRTVDADGLDYAPATTASELEMFFTRARPGVGVALYVARRGSRTEAFGEVRRVGGVDGFVEGPTVSPDGRGVYFHRKEGEGRFGIWRVGR